MTIGNEIKRLRIEKNINQKDLAGDVFSRSYISQIERGNVLPSSKAILHVAKVFDISPTSLVDSKTISRIMNKEEVFEIFLSARVSYLQGAYETCIPSLSLVVIAEDLLASTDWMSAKVWLVDAYFQLGQIETALDLIDEYSTKNQNYSRAEHAILLKLNHIEGIINYDKGNYDKSLSSFLAIEHAIEYRNLDVDKSLIIDNLSRIQMLYESLGNTEKVDKYNQQVIKLSKKLNLISKGTLRSINRYYRDNSTDSVEEMVAFYESMMETARFIGDDYRFSVLHSSIVELYLKHECLSKLEESLEKSKIATMAIKSPALRGYSLAFHYLFTGRYYVKLKAYDKAVASYTKAQAYISDNRNSKSIKLEIDSLYNYSELYYHKGEMESAKLYIHMAENISKENNTIVRNTKINQLKTLIYEKIGS